MRGIAGYVTRITLDRFSGNGRGPRNQPKSNMADLDG
jgi:hypothetical protein